MDRIVEEVDMKTGRKVYQYYDGEGNAGRIVSRRRDLTELQAQGQLQHLRVEDLTFNSKRKRTNHLEDTSTSVIENKENSMASNSTSKENSEGKKNIQIPGGQIGETVDLDKQHSLVDKAREDFCEVGDVAGKAN